MLLDNEAGKAFEKAAQIHINNLKEHDDAANIYADAFKVYSKDSPQDAVRCIEFSIEQYCAKGNFRRAAKHKESVGDLYKKQIGDMKSAIKAYEKAARWYESDGAGAYVFI